MLDAREALGVSQGLEQPGPVLHVPGVVADPGVEDVLQAEVPQEYVRQDSHDLREILLLALEPEASEVGDGVDLVLPDAQEVHEGHVAHVGVLGEGRLDHLLVVLDEGDDGLAVVLGDVLGLVLLGLGPFYFVAPFSQDVLADGLGLVEELLRLFVGISLGNLINVSDWLLNLHQVLNLFPVLLLLEHLLVALLQVLVL